MTNGSLGRGTQSALAYHFKKDRFPTHRPPQNRSFLKRSLVYQIPNFKENAPNFIQRENPSSPKSYQN